MKLSKLLFLEMKKYPPNAIVQVMVNFYIRRPCGICQCELHVLMDAGNKYVMYLGLQDELGNYWECPLDINNYPVTRQDSIAEICLYFMSNYGV